MSVRHFLAACRQDLMQLFTTSCLYATPPPPPPLRTVELAAHVVRPEGLSLVFSEEAIIVAVTVRTSGQLGDADSASADMVPVQLLC